MKIKEDKRQRRDKEAHTYKVKNIRTGDVYLTSTVLEKKTIDGVEFTQVLQNGKLQLLRSDSLVKIKKIS